MSKVPRDSVDIIVSQWKRERPGIDPWPSAVAARFLRITTHLKKATERALLPIGCSWEMFEMLAALRRSGPPYALNPTALYKSMLLTSGAMTARLDRAEKAGLIRRSADPQDRRAVLVHLTPAGMKLADAAVDVYFEMVKRVLGDISATDRKQFIELLSVSLTAFETESNSAD